MPTYALLSMPKWRFYAGLEPKPFSSQDFAEISTRWFAIIGTCASILGRISPTAAIPVNGVLPRHLPLVNSQWIGWWWCKGDTQVFETLVRPTEQTGNLEHIQRWSFSWELIAHARTSSLSRQIWGTPILLIVRPTYATITISTTITTSVVY